MNVLARVRRTRTAPSKAERAKEVVAWPNTAQSTGRFIVKIGRQNCWEAVGEVKTAFQTLGPAIKRYLDDCSEPIPNWVTWSIYMVGYAPATATPTIIFCSDVEIHRKQIRDRIRDSSVLKGYPTIALKHLARAPDFNQLVQLAGSMNQTANDLGSLIYCTSAYLAPGSQLLVPSKDCTAAPRRATAGGFVRIGGKYYCMTAGHVFDDEPVAPSLPVEDDELYFSDSSVDDTEIDEEASWSSAQPSPHRESRTVRPPSVPSSAMHDNVTTLLDSEKSCTSSVKESMTHQEPQSSGIPTNAVPIGEPSISSLDGACPELDYAFVEVPANLAVEQKEHHLVVHSEKLARHIDLVARSGPEFAPVFAVTASGNYLLGALSGTSSFVRLPGSYRFQEVYTVHFDMQLQRGDCGSWVMDARNGKLHGHIVAGCPISGIAYIIPSHQVFDDVERCIGQRPLVCTHPHQVNRFVDADNLTKNAATNVSDVLFRQQSNSSAARPGCGESNHKEKIELSAAEMTERFRKLLSVSRMNVLQKSTSEILQKMAEPEETTESIMNKLGTQTSRTAHPPMYASIHNLPLLPVKPLSPTSLRFRDFVLSLSNSRLQWENPERLDEALQAVPLQQIYKEAEEEFEISQIEAQTLGVARKPVWGYQDCVIRALMRWFKRDYFTWVNNPECGRCFSPTIGISRVEPNDEELARSACVTEVYRCSNQHCGELQRFPRYQDPFLLLKERRGRNGEWANCFGMLCRALGSRVRWVWSSEDHVWCEVYSIHQSRWIHVDPCEEAWDNPRLYTTGWGRRMGYCLAFSDEGAFDVTCRYVRTLQDAKDRTRCSESELLHILDELRNLRHANVSKKDRIRLQSEHMREQRELTVHIIRRLVHELTEPKIVDLPEGRKSKELELRKKSTNGESLDNEAPRYVQ